MERPSPATLSSADALSGRDDEVAAADEADASSRGPYRSDEADHEAAPNGAVDVASDRSPENRAGKAEPETDAAPAPPPFIPMHPLRAGGYMLASVVLALAQGYGQSVVSANLTQLQGGFGATQAETAWLAAAYLAPNVSLTLLLIKIRAQFGLRNFAELAILGFLATALVNYAADDLSANLAVRFMSGIAAAPMTSLAFLYMLEPLPPERKMTLGLSLALTVIFMGSPFTRLISPHLLDVGLWHGLTAMEVALALLGFGLIYLLPLTSPPRQKVIAAADIISFLLIAIGFGSASVALTLGPIYWWIDATWIGALLAIAIAAVTVAAMIELNRADPLIDIRWLASPPILHFAAALLLFRLVLSEQTSGAPGLMRAFSLTNGQTQTLFAVILLATIAGGLTCAATMKPGREEWFHIVALALIIVGASMDACATSQTRPEQLYLSQALLGFAGALFMPPALLSGLRSALAKGSQYILSFVIVFLVTQKLGGTLGAAIFSTFVKVRQALHLERLHEALSATSPLVAERVAALAGAYGAALADPSARNANALSALGSQASLEATVLAYNDAFMVIALIAAAALLALLVHIAIVRLAAFGARAETAQPV